MKFALWPCIWSIYVNVSCVLKNNIYFVVVGYSFYISNLVVFMFFRILYFFTGFLVGLLKYFFFEKNILQFSVKIWNFSRLGNWIFIVLNTPSLFFILFLPTNAYCLVCNRVCMQAFFLLEFTWYAFSHFLFTFNLILLMHFL